MCCRSHDFFVSSRSLSERNVIESFSHQRKLFFSSSSLELLSSRLPEHIGQHVKNVSSFLYFPLCKYINVKTSNVFFVSSVVLLYCTQRVSSSVWRSSRNSFFCSLFYVYMNVIFKVKTCLVHGVCMCLCVLALVGAAVA